MSESQRFTKDLSDFANALMDHFFNDQVTIKALEVVNTFAAKEKSSVDDVEKLLQAVESGHDNRIAKKQELIKTIATYCQQLGLAQFIEGVAPFIKTLCNSKLAPPEAPPAPEPEKEAKTGDQPTTDSNQG